MMESGSREGGGEGEGLEPDTSTTTAPLPAKFVIGASDEDFEDPPDLRDEMEPGAVVPPDGGWGWVVVAASFMCNVVVDGIIFSCGMLLPKFKEEFGVSNSEVSWVSSLLSGFYLIVGPFVSAIANAYGFRTVCILGAIISSIAFGLSSFATNIYFLQFTFGVVGGIGFGFIYVPAVIATGFYFEKRRALATGIAVCGSGIGTFIFAPLNNYLVATINWRWTLIVYAGISLSCAVFGLAFRPLEANSQSHDYDLDPPGTPLLMRIKRARDEQMRQCASAISMTSMNSKAPSNYDEPISEADVKFNKNVVARTLLERHGAHSQKRYSFPGIVISTPDPIKEETEGPLIECNGKEDCEEGEDNEKGDKVLDNNKNETHLKVPHQQQQRQQQQAGQSHSRVGKCPRNKSAPILHSHVLLSADYLRRPSRLRTETSRPFYRDDIFYSGSMRRLPEYRSSESVERYHQSVTHLPLDEIVEEEEDSERQCRCCPAALTNIIRRIFDFSLLRSPTFVVLGMAGFMSLMALFVPFMFLPGYAAEQGIDEGSIATLVATIGITNTLGRIACGWISDHPKVDALYVNNFSLMLGGGATMLLPFISDQSLLLLYSVAFGVSVAAFASLRSILLVELLGLERLTNAFGLLLLFQGIAGIFGSPVAGAFVDLTESYDISFYVFGGIFAFSGVMCFPLRWVKRWEDDRTQKRLEANNIEMAA